MYTITKRCLVLILAALLLCTTGLPVFAEEAGDPIPAALDPKVAEIIISQLTETELADFANTELYHANMEGRVLSGQPIIWMCNAVPLVTPDNSLEAVLAVAIQRHQNGPQHYVVLSPNPYGIYQSGIHKPIEIFPQYTDSTPSFVTDLLALTETFTILDQECTLQNVYCFHRAFGATIEAIIYLKTDKGVFVKYYANEQAPANIFTEAEFKTLADEYFRVISAYENNYDENGNPLGGDYSTFASYLETRPNPPAESFHYAPWILGGCGALCLLAIALLLLLKKRKV